MSHPPGPTYHQYAMRPQIPQGYPPPGQNYGAPPPQQQDAQRFYTPAPAQEPSQYPPSSPPPNNFQRPGPGATPAPFYVAGAEVPSQQNQIPPPTPQQQSQQPQQPQYAQRPSEQRVPSGGKQPAPLQTSSSPPPANQYTPYQAPQSSARPQSTYGSGPQELSTSVYDSPIAPQNANPAAPYPPSAYATPDEDPYTAAAASNSSVPTAPTVPPPSVPAPSAPSPELQQPSYGQPYSAYHAHPPQQTPYRAPGGVGVGASGSYDAATVDGPRPHQQQPLPSGLTMSPPPLHPSGPAYDARQSLPSRVGGPSGPGSGGGAPAMGGAPPQPQYKAYVPPGSSSAPGLPPADDGPTAPTAPAAEGYYRTAAY